MAVRTVCAPGSGPAAAIGHPAAGVASGGLGADHGRKDPVGAVPAPGAHRWRGGAVLPLPAVHGQRRSGGGLSAAGGDPGPFPAAGPDRAGGADDRHDPAELSGGVVRRGLAMGADGHGGGLCHRGLLPDDDTVPPAQAVPGGARSPTGSVTDGQPTKKAKTFPPDGIGRECLQMRQMPGKAARADGLAGEGLYEQYTGA